MPQPSSCFQTASFSGAFIDQDNHLVEHERGRAAGRMSCHPALEPNNSTGYASSCGVDSAQHNSCPMDWAGAMPSAAAGVELMHVAAPSAPKWAAVPGVTNQVAVPAAGDPIGSAVAAAAAAANPWAWLSDVATGGGSSSSSTAAPAPPCGDKVASLTHHTASRRLFMAPGDPKASMQWKLQQQAQHLQAELAMATQQLQMQSITFNTATPATTMAR